MARPVIDRQAAWERLTARRTLEVPTELPIATQATELVDAIRDHQVVVVAGETGSGKSTQIPKLCLRAGRGRNGLIGHTQPRRVAARSVAERVAEEIGTTVGGAVGYTVRFDDHVGDDTVIQVMTDGILLNEIQRDSRLSRYDTLIIDEAHERSLNVDFILGYLRELLPKRPDLHVIITSATIDTDRFAEHFASDGVPAPVFVVEGRTYPVEIRYRPFGADNPDDEHDKRDQLGAMIDAVDELWSAIDGDILVFLSGEREIRDAADALSDRFGNGKSRYGLTEVLPLYARLSAHDQHRIFQHHSARRVVLSTNIAETSLTVPGIRAVIDTGTARISRYSKRLKVQRLPIEEISQASANQRSGRCGRVAPGIAIRLYSQENFAERPEFTEPEILRTSLASVILQMTAIGLGDVSRFPFVEAPDASQVRDGYQLLDELGALRAGRIGAPRRLTGTGRKLARLPVDPRLARMIIEAERLGCVREVLVIASALSIQDVRERPDDKPEAAAEFHNRFRVPGSDLLSIVALWDYLRVQQQQRSSSAFRRMCHAEFLHYVRVREWRDLYSQLRRVAGQLHIRPEPTPSAADASSADGTGRPGAGRRHDASRRSAKTSSKKSSKNAPQNSSGQRAATSGAGAQSTDWTASFQPADHWDNVHRAVLAGLLSHIGERSDNGNEYLGARDSRFAIARGSVLAKRPPPWVMAAELVETNRLWARRVAAIQPEWCEELASHLVKRSYGEAWWDDTDGRAVTTESVTLYGRPIVANRRIGLDAVDPGLAREMFIRYALVAGEWGQRGDTNPALREFAEYNERYLGRVGQLTARVRRDDLYDDASLYAFYDERIPAEVTGVGTFDTWWSAERRRDATRLNFDTTILSNRAGITLADYPDRWHTASGDFALNYRYAPDTPLDGVSLVVPVATLGQLDVDGLDWSVPGYRDDLIDHLLQTLPKQVRRELIPMIDTAVAAADYIAAHWPTPSGPFVDALATALGETTGRAIDASLLRMDQLPTWLHTHLVVTDPDGNVIDAGDDHGAIMKRQGASVRSAVAKVSGIDEQRGLTDWTFGDLDRTVERSIDGGPTVRGFPTLVDARDSVALRVVDNEALQARAMHGGVRRLLTLNAAPSATKLASRLGSSASLVLAAEGQDPAALASESIAAAIDAVIDQRGIPWTEAAYRDLERAATREVPQLAADALEAAVDILDAVQRIHRLIMAMRAEGLQPTVRDAQAHRDRLIAPGFVQRAGTARLPDVHRYLRGIEYRLGHLDGDVARDARRMAEVHPIELAFARAVEELDTVNPEVREVAWMIEEYRLSIFATPIGVVGPVSVKRIRTAYTQATGKQLVVAQS